MVIRTSSSKQIDRLVADLSAERQVARDAAVARLTVLGTRAVERLIHAAAADQPTTPRLAALRALEAIADPRAIGPALTAIDDQDADLACAGIATARVFLRSARGAAVLDRLTTLALDPARREEVRVAALAALADLEPSTLKPLWKTLARDASPAVRRLAQSKESRRTAAAFAAPDAAAAGDRLPSDPGVLRQSIARSGSSMPLQALHALLDRVRDREAEERGSRRADWMMVRAEIQLVLAKRGSRLGVYDLRESLESGKGPLPVEFLTAMALVGDATCLESIAAAHARNRAAKSPDDSWRRQLAEAFRTLLKREHLTLRHAAVRKIAKRWGALPLA